MERENPTKNGGLISFPDEKSPVEAVYGLPALVSRAGKPAAAAWKDFFDGKLPNAHTRAGAVARLRMQDFYHASDQYCLHFLDKGGKSREIPVRHDLERYIREYIQAAGLENTPKSSPLFRTAIRKEKRLTETATTGHDICRMVKRRMKQAGLPETLSPHSFRVATATDLLEQGIPLDEVQYLLGHSDPRTTRLYDRREKRVTRNIVERISI